MRLFEGVYSRGCYHLKYAYMHISVRILYSASMASQVDEVFCFDIIVRGHHVYKQCELRRRLERSSATSLV